MMDNSVKVVFAMLSLAGCASIPAPAVLGNFVDEGARSSTSLMAEDVVKKLDVLYPPAHTSFRMQQKTPDSFGATLVEALRAKGYALAEFDPASVDSGTHSRGVTLAYIVDQPLEPGQYRVTVLLNKQSISRLYQLRGGVVSPAGAWIRKE